MDWQVIGSLCNLIKGCKGNVIFKMLYVLSPSLFVYIYGLCCTLNNINCKPLQMYENLIIYALLVVGTVDLQESDSSDVDQWVDAMVDELNVRNHFILIT